MRRPYLSLKQTPRDVAEEKKQLGAMQAVVGQIVPEKTPWCYIWRMTPLHAHGITRLYENVSLAGGSVVDETGVVTVKLARVYSKPGWVEYTPLVVKGLAVVACVVIFDALRVALF